MASQIIQEAIAVGAPAYNAGDIALCAEIYQVAAQQLLGTHLAELSPQIARNLEQAIFKAQAMQGEVGGRGSPVDKLAWSFRSAFDMQLSNGPVRDMTSTRSETQSASQIVAQAISEGAPKYNRGDHAGCASLYASVARSLMSRTDVDETARAVLVAAVRQAESSNDANANAWLLRRALEAAASGSTSRQVASVARSVDGTKQGGAVIYDVSKGVGTNIRPSVVNDTVMGGRSDSRVTVADEGAVFTGTVTKRGGGGFVSVRFEPADGASLASALRGRSGLAFDVRSTRGCKAWKLQLNEGYNAISWQADFVASGVVGVGLQRIPFSAFVPTWRGQLQGRPGLTSDALEKIRTFGFMLSFLTADGKNSSEFEEGPFSLTVARVETY